MEQALNVDDLLRRSGARLLVVAPHPDDESLAAGGLIQRARALGADVRVLLLTDGDNNPWPQRWLERRLCIDAAARRRWGERRRGEVLEALSRLDVPAQALLALGWTDLGVTARLCADFDAARDAFVARLRACAPTVIAAPALDDRHPDHSAARVLLELALADVAPYPPLLSYLVHGRPAQRGTPVVIALDAAMRERKRAAVLAHRTQVALSRGRLLRCVGDRELFRFDGPTPTPWRDSLLLPWRPPAWLHSRLDLLLAHRGGAQRVPWRSAPLYRTDAGFRLDVPAAARGGLLFVKLEARFDTAWIFDRWGWWRASEE